MFPNLSNDLDVPDKARTAMSGKFSNKKNILPSAVSFGGKLLLNTVPVSFVCQRKLTIYFVFTILN